jgi:integrase
MLRETPAGKRVLGYRKSDGRWQKKVNGQVKIFGRREDARDPSLSMEDRYAKALKEYDKFIDDCGGGSIRVYDVSELTVRELMNRYLEWMSSRQQLGEIKARTYAEMKAALQDFAKVIAGRADRLVATLGPDDFTKARVHWQKTCDVYTLSRNVAWVRSWLIWAEDEDHVEHRPKFGKMFKRAGMKALRENMVQKAIAAGDKAFTPAELQTILPLLGWEMRAPFLLGINCAFYAEDVAGICLKHLDLDKGVHWMPRGKNGNFRVGFLWDITVEAIKDYIANRWTKMSERKGYTLTADMPIFVTRCRNPFVHWTITRNDAGEITKATQSNNGTKELNKVLNAAGVKRAGLSFGSLRHTALTLIDDLGKETESALLAGHKRGGVIEFYVRKYTREADGRACRDAD